MKHIIYLAATALVCTTSLTTPALASHNAADNATISAAELQCSTLGATMGSAFAVTLDHASLNGTPTGAPAVDVGDPIVNFGSETAIGSPTSLTNVVANGLNTTTNGGGQNIFSDGTATASFASWTFDGTINTLVPHSFAFNCAVSETVIVAGGPENKGQCVSRIQRAGSTRSAAEDFCDILTNRQILPDTTEVVQHFPVPGNPIAQDVSSSRTISGELNTAFPSLAGTPFIVHDFAVSGVLACISPDSRNSWLGKHGMNDTDCAAIAAGMGLVPLAGKKGR